MVWGSLQPSSCSRLPGIPGLDRGDHDHGFFLIFPAGKPLVAQQKPGEKKNTREEQKTHGEKKRNKHGARRLPGLRLPSLLLLLTPLLSPPLRCKQLLLPERRGGGDKIGLSNQSMAPFKGEPTFGCLDMGMFREYSRGSPLSYHVEERGRSSWQLSLAKSGKAA